jgi:aldose 1-epimerase
MTVTTEPFGDLPGGGAVEVFTLARPGGLEARVATWGATLVSLRAPDRAGALGHVTLGFDRLEPYLGGHPYVGAVVGRSAGRIAGARFTLDGAEHRLAANDGPNHLHGGRRGFDRVLWRAEVVDGGDAHPAVRLCHRSPDGDEGYPGTLDVAVTYRLDPDGGLVVDYTATSDRATVVNLTHHAYWNLRDGGAGSDVRDHEVEIRAAQVLAVDEGLIPTGELRAVAGTALDLSAPAPLGARLDTDELRRTGGFDHTYVLRDLDRSPALAARVREPVTGRVMEVSTTEPGLQLYTANFLDLPSRREGVRCGPHAALCLEAQHFPDSPNRPAFPSTVLRPGETYRQTTIYRFGTSREP